eukprot:1915171-Rhodomonas_salina.1
MAIHSPLEQSTMAAEPHFTQTTMAAEPHFTQEIPINDEEKLQSLNSEFKNMGLGIFDIQGRVTELVRYSLLATEEIPLSVAFTVKYKLDVDTTEEHGAEEH